MIGIQNISKIRTLKTLKLSLDLMTDWDFFYSANLGLTDIVLDVPPREHSYLLQNFCGDHCRYARTKVTFELIPVE